MVTFVFADFFCGAMMGGFGDYVGLLWMQWVVVRELGIHQSFDILGVSVWL